MMKILMIAIYLSGQLLYSHSLEVDLLFHLQSEGFPTLLFFPAGNKSSGPVSPFTWLKCIITLDFTTCDDDCVANCALAGNC